MRPQISFEPTSKQIHEIKSWLELEYKKFGEGFYANWKIIAGSAKQSELATISVGSKTLGFMVFSIREFRASIDIVSIKIDYRRRGIGKHLVETAFNKFRQAGIYAVNLQCSPTSSETYWRLLGFNDIPHGNRSNVDHELYKVLVDNMNATRSKSKIVTECIELWDVEPDASRNASPKWVWKVKFRKGSRELQKPIVHPAYSDWRIRWRRGDETLLDDKVKYFDDDGIQFGKFIIIKSLPTPSHN